MGRRSFDIWHTADSLYNRTQKRLVAKETLVVDDILDDDKIRLKISEKIEEKVMDSEYELGFDVETLICLKAGILVKILVKVLSQKPEYSSIVMEYRKNLKNMNTRIRLI